MCQHQACRHPLCVLPGNPWQQLLLSHFLVLGGWILAILMATASPWQAIIIKPVLLACLECSGDYERSTFCPVACVRTYSAICPLQPLVSTEGMSLKVA